MSAANAKKNTAVAIQKTPIVKVKRDFFIFK